MPHSVKNFHRSPEITIKFPLAQRHHKTAGIINLNYYAYKNAISNQKITQLPKKNKKDGRAKRKLYKYATLILEYKHCKNFTALKHWRITALLGITLQAKFPAYLK